MTPEGILKKQVCDWLDGAGVFYRRLNTGVIRKGSRFIHLCPEGTGDIVVFPAYGMPRWIELKVIGQKTSRKRQESQAAFAEQVRRLGHSYARCETLDAVIAFVT